MNILICGFMGAGKTAMLASFKGDSKGYTLFDLDGEIAAMLSISPLQIGQWINEHGLLEFRRKEMAVLKGLLAMKFPKVIALGGGTLEAEGFWPLPAHCRLVFLDTPLTLCLERIKGDPNRPLVKEGEAALRALYEKRLPLYRQADLTVTENVVGLATLVHNLLNKA